MRSPPIFPAACASATSIIGISVPKSCAPANFSNRRKSLGVEQENLGGLWIFSGVLHIDCSKQTPDVSTETCPSLILSVLGLCSIRVQTGKSSSKCLGCRERNAPDWLDVPVEAKHSLLASTFWVSSFSSLNVEEKAMSSVSKAIRTRVNSWTLDMRAEERMNNRGINLSLYRKFLGKPTSAGKTHFDHFYGKTPKR